MGVYIPNMKMPTSCRACPLATQFFDGEDVCAMLGTYVHDMDREDDCPLVFIPPHGRLGDLDKLIDRLTDLEESTRRFNPPDDIHGFNNGLLCGISNVIGEIRYYTPTVIEAEGSK